jgi:hypothetical protein
MIPEWLHALSIAYLLFGGLCATVIAFDVARRPQHMWIMNVVWPVTALFGTAWIAALPGRRRYSRLSQSSNPAAECAFGSLCPACLKLQKANPI